MKREGFMENKMIYVCQDHYGHPFIDKTSCFWVNTNFIIKIWKEERTESKFGTEFEMVDNTYYMGTLAVGNQTQTFHFVFIKDYYKLIGEEYGS